MLMPWLLPQGQPGQRFYMVMSGVVELCLLPKDATKCVGGCPGAAVGGSGRGAGLGPAPVAAVVGTHDSSSAVAITCLMHDTPVGAAITPPSAEQPRTAALTGCRHRF
jgi:hypothetical protein